MPEVLPRIRQHINFESNDKYEPESEMDSDEEAHREKLTTGTINNQGSESDSDKEANREKFMVETNSVQCDPCKSSVMFSRGLRSHKNQSHSGKFKCPEYTYAFREEKMLKEHKVFLHAPTEGSIRVSAGESPAGTSNHSELDIEIDSSKII